LYYHLLREGKLDYEGISARLDISRQEASVIVKWLEAHDLIHVARDKDDIRKFLIFPKHTPTNKT